MRRAVLTATLGVSLVSAGLAAPWALSAVGPAPTPLGTPREGLAVAPSTPDVQEFRLTRAEAVGGAGDGGAQRRTPTPEVAPEAAPDSPADAGPDAGPDAVDGPGLTDEASATQRGDRLVVVSDPQPVTGYGVVGATWDGPRPGVLRFAVRTRVGQGGWSGWQTVHGGDCPCEACVGKRQVATAAGHGPNVDSAEFAGTRQGTDAMAVGEVDEVQLRVTSPEGKVPADLRLAVIDPQPTVTGPDAGEQPAGEELAPAADTIELAAATTTGKAPKPKIYTRAAWGANERMRSGSPSYGTVRAGFVHHTVNANSYTKEQVPSIIRGIYAYHTQSRGWSDIGYNFLVDKFGRIWEGRYGGMNRAVIGAHTLGYNHLAFAGSAIGNFDVAEPPAAVATAYAKLMAWKLDLHGVNASARPTLSGRTFHAISGHRDAGSTACPGRYLYSKLPGIRSSATKIQKAARTGSTAPTPTPTPTPKPSPTPTPTPTPTTPPLIDTPDVARDIDGDGRADLVVRRRSDGQLHLLAGQSGPGFDARAAVPGAWQGLDVMVGLGDLDQNGNAELLTRNRSTGVVRVRSLRPDNRLGASWKASVTDKFAGMDLVVSVGDLVGAAPRDLVVRDARTQVLWIYAGTADGRFRKPARLQLGTTGDKILSLVHAGDLTGDGLSDLMAINAAGDLLRYPGSATGVVGKPTRLATGWQRRSLASAALDLTGDGRTDLLWRNRKGVTGIQEWRPDGGLDRSLVQWNTWSDLSEVTPLAAGTGAAQARVLGTTKAGGRVVIAARGESWFAPAAGLRRSVPDADFVGSAGDWNGDGVADILTRGSTGRIILHAGSGEQRLAPTQAAARGWGEMSDLVLSADVNGDGKPDMIARDTDGAIYVHPGDGEGGMGEPVLARSALFPITSATAVGKWNGDRWRDLVVRRKSTGRVFLLPGKAGGLLGKRVPLEGDFSPYDRFVGVGDQNGDGRPDLLATTKAGELWLLAGTPTGIGARTYLGSGMADYDLLG